MKAEEKAKLAQDIMQVLSQLRRTEINSEVKKKIRDSEFRLLITLQQSGPVGVRVSDLSAKMGITPAGVTHMINSLEQGGYLGRLADATDRRVVLVKLTDKGTALIRVMKSEFLEYITGLVNFLGKDDSKKFLGLLQKSLTYLVSEKRNATL